MGFVKVTFTETDMKEVFAIPHRIQCLYLYIENNREYIVQEMPVNL